MTQVEVKVLIDVQDPKQAQALNALFATLAGEQVPQKNVQSPKEVAETKEAPAEETKDDAPEIKIEEVRALLAKKVGLHRSEIKSKLTALGAPNVTALAKDKYPEFVEFLNGLK